MPTRCIACLQGPAPYASPTKTTARGILREKSNTSPWLTEGVPQQAWMSAASQPAPPQGEAHCYVLVCCKGSHLTQSWHV